MENRPTGGKDLAGQFNTLRLDKGGSVKGRRDPEKEFQLLEKLGEGFVCLFCFGFFFFNF